MEIVKETFGQRMRRLRKAARLSQAKLASLAGMDESYINQLENDRAGGPTLRTIQALAAALGVGPEQFLSSDISATAPPKGPRPKSVDELLREIQERMELLVLVEIAINGRVPSTYPCNEENRNLGLVNISKESIKSYDSRKLYALIVRGECLEGDGIHTGDRLIVLPVKEVDIQGKIYICRVGNQCLACHVENTPEGKFRLRSSNSDYQEKEPGEVEILGRAIRAVSPEKEL